MATIAIDARIINSGTGRYVVNLLRQLEEIDAVNSYLILVPKKDLTYYQPTNPNFRIIEADFANYSLAEQTGFLNLINKLSPDLTHFCMPQQPIRFKGQHVTTFHDLTLLQTYNSDKNFAIYKFKQLVGRFVFKHVAKSSAHIFTPTKYVKDQLTTFAHIDPAKVTVTYEGSAVTKVTPATYEPLEHKSFLLYVGTQSDYKNIRRLMQAHHKLRETHPDLLLVLVGKINDQLATNRDWARAQGFEGVVYTGFLPDDQLRWCMGHTMAYVFPSLMEGFGLPAVEAAASGAPLVVSNATCLPEVHQDAAEYFNPLNVDDMAKSIARVIDDPTKRRELIKKGLKNVQRFSWQAMAEQTYNIYMQLLDPK